MQDNLQELYNKEFYDAQSLSSYTSAQGVLGYLQGILPETKSVIDVGCGVGTWLRAWKDINPNIEIFGIDGNDVDENLYYIPLDCYKKVDLTLDSALLLNQVAEATKYNGGGKPYNLVQSLEVAEHLYEEYAENFIKLLTSLGDIVLFSAAIPLQGGTHHVNEQPPEYWAKIFAKYDFVCFDILRTPLWDNKNISFWYVQNAMLFVHKSKASHFENLGFKSVENPMHLVHYEGYQRKSIMANNLQMRKKWTYKLSRKGQRLIDKIRGKKHK